MPQHNIAPIYDNNSKILILGSFPSVKSREVSFYYAHPQNRFWKVLSSVFGKEIPQTVEEKTEFLLKNNIALWDVIKSCDIIGSSDSSITNVVPNDIKMIIDNSDIKKIFVNGKKAENLYNKYILEKTNFKAFCLPSTSPANASWNEKRLIDEWNQIKVI